MEQSSVIEKRVVWLAAAIQLVNIIDFMMVLPLGPDIATSLFISNSSIGYIGGSYTLAVALSGLICARFLDKFDRKSVAILAMLGLSLATFSASFAWNLPSLIAARIIAGFFGGPAASMAMAMVMDVVPPQRRGKALSIVMSSFSVASVLAIPFALELASWGGWKFPFYITAVIGLFTTFIIYWLMPPMTLHFSEKNRHGISVFKLLARREVRMGIFMMSASMFTTFLIVPHVSAYFQYNLFYPRETLGLLYFGGGIVAFFTMQIGGRLSDKIGAFPLVLAGSVILMFTIFDGFIRQPLLPLLFIFMLFMGSNTLRNISASVEATKIPQKHERAAFMSLLSTSQHIASGLAAMLSSTFLLTLDSGALVGMKNIAVLSMAIALLQPVFLFKLIRGKNKFQKQLIKVTGD